MLNSNGYRGRYEPKMDGKIVFFILLCFALISGCLSSQDSAKGTLRLTSSPSGAEIYLDNQFRGSTPVNISSVEQGNHTLEFRYPGYQSWAAVISVSSGTSNYYAALTPRPDMQGLGKSTPPTTVPPMKVTVQAVKPTFILGESMSFSGTGTGSKIVTLTVYGPGYYAEGVVLDQPKVNSAGLWSYLWNPGFSLQSGPYTLVVVDDSRTSSDRVEFNVIGGGEVTVASNSYSAARGENLIFSGRCTTGAQNVLLILYGPEQFSGGIELGSVSVTADKTWSFKYALDNYMPTGHYTMYVRDIPSTSSGTTQFTVGFTS
jgi:hypothetical protein